MNTWQLADDTVLVVNPKDWKMAKKFGNYQHFGALVLTLFPSLFHPIAETMYSIFSDSDLETFIRASLATQMVISQYGKVPEGYFDHMYACAIAEEFYVYVWKNRVVEMCEHPDARLRQLTITPEAVDKLLFLLKGAKKVEPCDPEPMLFVEDSTPEVVNEDKSSVYILPNRECAHDDCSVYVAAQDILEDGHSHDLVEVTESIDHECGLVPPWKFAIKNFRLFSEVLSFDYNRILVFGSSFRQLELPDVSERIRECRTGDWYLCRVRWFPPVAHVKGTT